MTDETRNPVDASRPTTEAKRETPPAGREVPHAPYEKTTADLRKEEESAFPFSVTVGQVYEGP